MKVNKQNPSIVEFKKALQLDFCKQVIHKFNTDKRVIEGLIVNETGVECVDKSIRQTQVLNLSTCEDWKEEDNTFFTSLTTCLGPYLDHVVNIFYRSPFDCPPVDSGYEIQKTSPKGFFTWHVDAIKNTVPMRKLTYMWYLNSCEEGCTEFAFGQKIKPEAGKLLIFPSTWPYVHQGTPPKTTKYVCTGWLS
jgi:hypothetical protein